MRRDHQRVCAACAQGIDPLERRIQTDADTDYHAACYSRIKRDKAEQNAHPLTAHASRGHAVTAGAGRAAPAPMVPTPVAGPGGASPWRERAGPRDHPNPPAASRPPEPRRDLGSTALRARRIFYAEQVL